MDKSPDAFRTISEVADWLGTPTHVLRFWESRFSQIKPVKRAGGRRYYRPADMTLLGGIKKLLHDDGLTIRGVQKILREQGVRYVSSLSQPVDGEDLVEEAGFAQDVPTEPPRAELVQLHPSAPPQAPADPPAPATDAPTWDARDDAADADPEGSTAEAFDPVTDEATAAESPWQPATDAPAWDNRDNAPTVGPEDPPVDPAAEDDATSETTWQPPREPDIDEPAAGAPKAESVAPTAEEAALSEAPWQVPPDESGETWTEKDIAQETAWTAPTSTADDPAAPTAQDDQPEAELPVETPPTDMSAYDAADGDSALHAPDTDDQRAPETADQSAPLASEPDDDQPAAPADDLAARDDAVASTDVFGGSDEDASSRNDVPPSVDDVAASGDDPGPILPSNDDTMAPPPEVAETDVTEPLPAFSRRQPPVAPEPPAAPPPRTPLPLPEVPPIPEGPSLSEQVLTQLRKVSHLPPEKVRPLYDRLAALQERMMSRSGD